MFMTDGSLRTAAGGRALARNSLYNLVGQALPLMVALVFIPRLVNGLGTERFGILAMIWTVMGYLGLFDFGLSRATTRFTASALGTGDREKLARIFSTSMTAQAIFGVLACIVLLTITPVLVERVFRIPSVYIDEARNAFYVLAGSLPFLITLLIPKGVLEAYQRFDLVNLVQGVSSSLVFILPVAGIYAGFKLPGIVALLAATRIAACIAFFVLCFKVSPELRRGFAVDRTMLRPLFGFGSWVTVSNLVGPLLIYIDRFMIGALISMAALAYYTVPYEIVIRFMLFPTSMVAVLFPLFSSAGEEEKENFPRIYTRSIKYLLMIMGPLVMIMFLFADEILGLWLGPEFAKQSTAVLRIIALGVLLTPVQISVGMLQGIGRPDVSAKFYALELIVYVPLVWFLATRFGLSGVALAWTLRAALDTILLILASNRLLGVNARAYSDNGLLRGGIAVAVLCTVFLGLLFLGLDQVTRTVIAFVSVVIFLAISWKYGFDSKDRDLLSFGLLAGKGR